MEHNNIYLDNCMNFMKTMPDKSVTMTLTDIPYNGCNRPSGGLRNLDKQEADIITFDLNQFVNEIKRVTKESIYIFCGINQISPIYNILDTNMTTRLCVWKKTNPSPMNGQYLWLSATENCVFGRYPGATFIRNCAPNIWEFPAGTSKFHPTQKPIELFAYIIQSSTKEGDLIFDPCCGSGTTGVACIATDRKYLLVEQKEEWFKKAKKRLHYAKQHDIFTE